MPVVDFILSHFFFRQSSVFFSYLPSPFPLRLSHSISSLFLSLSREWMGCLSLEESGTQLSLSGAFESPRNSDKVAGWHAALVALEQLAENYFAGQVTLPHQHPTWASLTCS